MFWTAFWSLRKQIRLILWSGLKLHILKLLTQKGQAKEYQIFLLQICPFTFYLAVDVSLSPDVGLF